MGVFERIKKVRQGAGLTQEEFGARVGVSKNTQMRYEKGLRHPDTEYLSAVAKAFNVDTGWLMTNYETSDAERLNIARYQVLGRIAAELGVSNEQVGLLIDWAFEGKPEWVEMARSMVAKRMLAALSPAEQAIIEAYRSADETGKKTLEMTATLAKGSRA